MLMSTGVMMSLVDSRRRTRSITSSADVEGQEQVDAAPADVHADRCLHRSHLLPTAIHDSVHDQRPPVGVVARRRRLAAVCMDLRRHGDG